MPVFELLQSKTAEIAAIASAAMFPLGLIFLKKGYDHSTPLYGTLIVTAINAVLLWLFALLFSSLPITVIFSSAVIFFIWLAQSATELPDICSLQALTRSDRQETQ